MGTKSKLLFYPKAITKKMICMSFIATAILLSCDTTNDDPFTDTDPSSQKEEIKKGQLDGQ